MNKSNILFFALFSILTSAIMTSCSKENMDNENLDPDEVIVDVVVDSTNTETCDNLLSITSDAFNFSNTGEAYLFKMSANCNTGGSNSQLNFHVVDANWDYWGSNEPNIFAPTDGMPGFAFGTELDAQIGDTIYIWKNFIAGGESLIYFDSLSTNQALENDYIFTLSEMGDEEGEFIGGSITGSFINEVGNTNPFEASFCVPITVACE